MSENNLIPSQNQPTSLSTTTGWKRISPPRADVWVSWRDVAPTTTIVGRVVGFHTDKFGQSVAFIQNEAGVIGVPLPHVLRALFEKGGVCEGSVVAIEYCGRREGPRGAYHDFNVMVKERQDEISRGD